MKKYLLISAAIIISFLSGLMLVFCMKNHREMRLYGEILEECEWVWKNADTYKKIRGQGMDDRYDGIYGYAVNAIQYDYTLCYCIKDLNDNGVPELVIGVKYPVRDESFLGKSNESGDVEYAYRIMMLFYYCGEEMNSYMVDRYFMQIYKDGIVEWCGGAGKTTEYIYYQLAENGELVILDELKAVEDNPALFYQIAGENQMEILEEEFRSRRNAFTGGGEETFIWKEMDGLGEW